MSEPLKLQTHFGQSPYKQNYEIPEVETHQAVYAGKLRVDSHSVKLVVYGKPPLTRVRIHV